MKQLFSSSFSDNTTNNFFKTLSLLTLSLTAITLIALQEQFVGWLLFSAGVLFTVLNEKTFSNHILLIYGSVFLLGITPISTSISYQHMMIMGMYLSFAVIFPYVASRYAYGDHLVRFKWGKNIWTKKSISYIVFAVPLVYLVLPFLLRDSGSYLNWTVEPGTWNLTRLFIGTNALGIWDELFFINTVFILLHQHVRFAVANVVQSILFTSFLYELGFQGYMFVVIFLFALLQGYIFKKTESLAYVITIHLLFDFILYLVLIHLHHPEWLRIFIT